jgi:hypothetical protein
MRKPFDGDMRVPAQPLGGLHGVETPGDEFLRKARTLGADDAAEVDVGAPGQAHPLEDHDFDVTRGTVA